VNALKSAFTQFVPSRDARVYACGVGPREDRSGVISPTAPTTWPVWGATAKPPVFTHLPGGFADVEGGGVMVRANWSRIASRNRMRRQGVEDRKDKPPVASEPPKQPRNYLVPRSGSRRHLLHATRPTFHSRRQQSRAEGLRIEAGSGWSPKSTVERWTAFPSSSTMRRKRRFS